MGKHYEGGFQAVQEYFQQKFCRFCSHPFTSEGVKLLREEPGIMVVHVTCLRCGQPLGVAIVGTATRTKAKSNRYSLDWTKHDAERLSALPSITYDDVLDAHQFFSTLNADWSKHIPRSGRASR